MEARPVAEFHVTWRVFPQQDLLLMSAILSGLADLEESGQITLSIEYSDEIFEVPLSLMALAVTERRSGAARSVAIDFYDRSDKVIIPILDRVDVYFKRQFESEALRTLPQGALAKILPLGHTLCGFSRRSWKLVAAAINGSLRTSAARRARGSWPQLLHRTLSDASTWMLQLPPGYVASMARTDKSARIIFQPRLWKTTPGSGDIFDIANRDRIAMVRALRHAFGSEHTIGLVHSPMAQLIEPELQLAKPVNTRAYFEQLGTASIAVNCVGLSGSVGWKLAEYLGAGTAVVSQPIEKHVEPPIKAGAHYLPYHSPEECVAQCRRLLESPEEARVMGMINRAYYDKWIDPPAMVSSVLRRIFARGPDG